MGVWERRYYRVLNAWMRFLLRSPLHRLRSGRRLLLEFRGRRSGRRFRMPVSYWQRSESEVVCLTTTRWSRWWRNLDDADATLVLRGRERPGHATLVVDPGLRRTLVSGFLRRNPGDAAHYEVGTDGRGTPLAADLDALADSPETKVISVVLAATTTSALEAQAAPSEAPE
jgi:hypothetical protein